VRLPVFYSNHQGYLARLFSFAGFALLASLETLRRPADLVYASSTPLTVSLPALAARLVRRVPYVFEVRDLWPDLPIAMGILRRRWLIRLLLWWERSVYLRAHRLVALAPGIAEGIRAKAGVPEARVLMVPNGSDTLGLRDLGRPARQQLPLPDGCFVLG
jgi:glycosyltransferase involved in cell wall biosynthesis